MDSVLNLFVVAFPLSGKANASLMELLFLSTRPSPRGAQNRH